MLEVQTFLLTKTIGQLEEEHGVSCSFSKSGIYFSLNYSQIDTKDDDVLAQKCRGLILARRDGQPSQPSIVDGKSIGGGVVAKRDGIVGETVILARPFDRFFNVGQAAAANIDWNDPKLSIQTKMDGSLGIVWYCPFTNQYKVATRGCPEADIPLDNQLHTFRTLFEKCLFDTNGLSFDQFTSQLDKRTTYSFEITSPLNTIVVKYPDYRLTFLGARSLETQQEINPKIIVRNIPIAHTHIYTNTQDLVNWVAALDPSQQEGIVAVDSQFRRVKIKSPAYVLASKMRESLGSSPRNCLEVILLEKSDDVLPLLPKEIQDNLLSIKEKVINFIHLYDQKYNEIKQLADQINQGNKKTFALLVQKETDFWPPPFYYMYDKKTNMKEFILSGKKDNQFSNSFLDQILQHLR